jgi:RimJ/RimL family protein N-acetyltransferase
MLLNALGQPVGDPLPDWQARAAPPRTPMVGHWCRVEPLDPQRHARDLYDANALDTDGQGWTYSSVGPFASFADYRAWCDTASLSKDPLQFAIVDLKLGRPTGTASLLRVDAAMGVMEVGFVKYSPLLQRTTAATEAMVLMMARAFDELGYRRYEWKCDSLNAASRAAALRLGFTFEGVFRNATIYKGRSRDTAWFSITDSEWPRLKAGHAAWLDPANFDATGQQRRTLAECLSGSR